MGCDIHVRLERKDHTGKWIESNLYNRKKEVLRVAGHRDYILFSLLADVRNSNDIEPIAELRGLPEDISKKNQKYFESWGSDSHSETHYILSELVYALEMITNTYQAQSLSRFVRAISFAAGLYYYSSRTDDFRVIICFDN